MLAVLLGVLLVVLKLLNVAPFATLGWWLVLAPFAAAAAWWHWSDRSGHTSRAAMRRDHEKRLLRQEQRKVALGITRPRSKKGL